MSYIDYRFLSGKAFYHKILVLILLFLALYILVPLIFLVISIPICGREVIEPISDSSSTLNINLMKVLQLFTQIGIFGISAWLFVRMQTNKVSEYLSLNHFPNFKTYLLSIGLLLCALPLVYETMLWNESIPFPEKFSSIYQSLIQQQYRSEEMMDLFLNTQGVSGLLFNVFLIALIPAFFEELFFRGALQKLFLDTLKNKHISIFIVAILFSAIHLQFFNFLPRFVLGLALGYMAFYSGSLWPSIVAHAINNGISIVIAWMYYNGYTRVNYQEIGETPYWGIAIISAIACIILICFLRKTHLPNKVYE